MQLHSGADRHRERTVIANRQFFAIGFLTAFLVVVLAWLLEDRDVVGDCRAAAVAQLFGTYRA
ncbi:MAG TPA: hypothetical protein VJ696_12520 [Rhodanobacteraceae bacterium]|nr:hypothetical protein [Rhodanobacteraceae bacterium]